MRMLQKVKTLKRRETNKKYKYLKKDNKTLIK